MNWKQLKNASLADIFGWAESQDWCQAMADCSQDSEWHSEGDVWTHTKMVCQELLKLDEWGSLSPNDKLLLLFTALFHDVAKPLTTKVDPTSGRTTSPKHAVKGELLARNLLREVQCDLNTREQICRLVRYHGRPAFLSERGGPVHELIRMSWLVNNKLLYLFAMADMRGRVTTSTNRTEEDLLYWKLQAEEAGCYNAAYKFANDHARFVFFRNDQPNPHYIPHEDYRCQVTILSGLPGSGKDNWLIQNRSSLPVVSLDSLRDEIGVKPDDQQGQVVQLAKERCREFLRDETSFALNSTNTSRQMRQRWVNLFADYNAFIEIVYLEPSLEVILRQNKSRNRIVPEAVIRRLAEKCEPPDWTECHRLVQSEVCSDN